MLYIDPEECIDCDACVEACPVDAIFAEVQPLERWQRVTEVNAGYYRREAAWGRVRADRARLPASPC